MSTTVIERELYRERYTMELVRRAQINDRVDAQVTLVTLFAGVVSYYILNFPTCSWNCLFWIFLGTFTVLCIGTILAMISVGLAVLTDKTAYLPSPNVFNIYVKDLVKACLLADPTNGKAIAEQTLIAQLDGDHLLLADANAQRNDFRDGCLRWSKRFVLIALLGFLATAIPHMQLSTSGS